VNRCAIIAQAESRAQTNAAATTQRRIAVAAGLVRAGVDALVLQRGLRCGLDSVAVGGDFEGFLEDILVCLLVPGR